MGDAERMAGGARLVLTGLLSHGASAQEARGDAAAGKVLALHNCASCHVVAANQDVAPMPNYGPKFSDVANRPTTTAASLRDFLSHHHHYANMPSPSLTPTGLSNVVAYILTLRHTGH